MTLWSLWVDPIEAAFADLAAEVELEALRQRRRGEQGPASAAAGAQELGNQEA